MSHPQHMPIELADIIATHRALFGAAVMEADSKDAEGAKPDADKSDKADKPEKGDSADETLGEGGIKALHAEREARRALEAKVKELEGAKSVLDELARVFVKDGAKPDATATLATQVAEMKQQLDEAKAEKAREALAKSVAAASGVTSAVDIELLKSLPDEAAMKAVAARIADAADQDRKRRGVPKPDQSAGKSGGGRPSSVAQVMEERRLAREKK